MSTPAAVPPDVLAAIDAAYEGTLTPEQSVLLDRALCSSEAARQVYANYFQLSTDLYFLVRTSRSSERTLARVQEQQRADRKVELARVPVPQPLMNRAFDYVRRPIPFVLIVLSITTVWVLVVIAQFYRPANQPGVAQGGAPDGAAQGRPGGVATDPAPKPSASAKYSAVIKKSQDAIWDGSPPAEGAELNAGDTLRLVGGSIEVQFKHGAEVVLQGPSVMRIEGDARARLQVGFLSAKVPSSRVDFVIDTPMAVLSQNGAELHCSVDAQGATDVHVTKGFSLTSMRTADRSFRVTPEMSAHLEPTEIDKQHQIADATLPEFAPLPIRNIEIDERQGAYAKLILAANPAGYWRFEEMSNPKITTARDSSSNGNHGRYRGRVGAGVGGPGIGGLAASFDGSASYIEIPYSSSIDSNSLSVEFWFMSSAQWDRPFWPGNGVLVSRALLGPEPPDWSLICGAKSADNNEGRLIVGIGHEPAPVLLYSKGGLNDGDWRFAVWTRTESGVNTFYVDGRPAGSVSDGGVAIRNNRPLVIGGETPPVDQGDPHVFFRGQIDELALYRYALSPETVLEHYRAGAGSQ